MSSRVAKFAVRTRIHVAGNSCNLIGFISECGQSTVHTHRIVGGTETAVNEFPWVAGIVVKYADSEHHNKVGIHLM